MKIRNVLLYFFAPLGVLFCILALVSAKMPDKPSPPPITVYVDKPVPISVFIENMEINSLVKYYKDNHYSEYQKIVDFYSSYTKNSEITEVIIDECLTLDFPIDRAFALANQESSFDPKARHKNGKTIDRGLFQLNDGSRPNWTIKQFYDIRINTHEGLSCMAWLNDYFKTNELSLAGYNAGYNAIDNKRLPFNTALSVFNIKTYERMLDKNFSIKVLPNLQYVSYEDGKIILK